MGVVGVEVLLVVVGVELVFEGVTNLKDDRLLVEGVVGDCKVDDDDSDPFEDVIFLDGRREVLTGPFSGENDTDMMLCE